MGESNIMCRQRSDTYDQQGHKICRMLRLYGDKEQAAYRHCDECFVKQSRAYFIFVDGAQVMYAAR